MKRILIGTGLTSAIAALALAPAALAGGPADGTACYAAPGVSSSCQWTADVNGEFGVAAQSWKVEQLNTVDSTWSTVASGTGPGAAVPGSLPSGVTYRLTVSGGGGALGSATGNGTI